MNAAAVLLAGLIFASSGPEDYSRPGRHILKIASGGWERAATIQVPSGYRSGRSIPVVLVFHGAGGSGDAYLDKNGWAKKAEAENFLVVAPDGLPARPGGAAQFLINPRLWNDGQLRASSPRTMIDDVAFVRDLLAELGKRFAVDSGRIFAVGHSNGAGMVFRLGSALSDKLAAIAPVAGHCWDPDPKPVRPLPALYIIGTEDPLVRLEGGEITTPWGRKTNPSVARSLRAWAKAIGAPTEPRDVPGGPGLRVSLYGDEKTPVFLKAIFVSGQGHGWPGGEDSVWLRRWIGPRSEALDATDAIWKFFRSISDLRQ